LKPAGGDAIVLDVKMGNGAFMPTVEAARELARIMVDIGTDAGRKTVGLISDMNQPLGHAVGNVLEVKEAIATLQGNGPADFLAHCLDVAGNMLLLAGKGETLEETKGLASAVIEDGRALEKFRQLVAAQGGDQTLVDSPEKLAQASFVEEIRAEQEGYIAGIDARAIGWSCVRLGGGRLEKGDKIDHAVGMVIPTKVGDKICEGDLLATIHANDEAKLDQSRKDFLNALTWSEEPAAPLPHLYDTIE
jgi:pyrimidine-nucleoside phosphorylase